MLNIGIALAVFLFCVILGFIVTMIIYHRRASSRKLGDMEVNRVREDRGVAVRLSQSQLSRQRQGPIITELAKQYESRDQIIDHDTSKDITTENDKRV